MNDESRRKPARALAGAAALVAAALALFFALFFARGERPPAAAPAAPPASPLAEAPAGGAVPARAAAPVAAPGGVGSAGPTDEHAAARAMPPPDAIDTEADNPPIAPELPKTPAWRMEKTRIILRAVERRAERLQAEITALDAGGKKAEADEKRVLLGRLQKQVAKMNADIAGYAEQIAAGKGDVPDDGHAHEGAPP
ncbi:MAG TPA: hypothetical protein VFS00_20020 [Polyangiaceae bacterium]|nr:hypothetical protein [Polyangiaceae bacterium]